MNDMGASLQIAAFGSRLDQVSAALIQAGFGSCAQQSHASTDGTVASARASAAEFPPLGHCARAIVHGIAAAVSSAARCMWLSKAHNVVR